MFFFSIVLAPIYLRYLMTRYKRLSVLSRCLAYIDLSIMLLMFINSSSVLFPVFGHFVTRNLLFISSLLGL